MEVQVYQHCTATERSRHTGEQKGGVDAIFMRKASAWAGSSYGLWPFLQIQKVLALFSERILPLSLSAHCKQQL